MNILGPSAGVYGNVLCLLDKEEEWSRDWSENMPISFLARVMT
jgi:hypothetical protein